MRLASFRVDDLTSWGVVSDGRILDVGTELSASFADLRAIIAADALSAVEGVLDSAISYAIDGIEWLPVIPNPDKILCVGLNYENHRLESNRGVVEFPTIFSRYANTQIGHKRPIVRPKVSNKLDYEGELAIVIGKAGRYISKEDAWDYIAGYACYNEGSVRDYQWHTHQFTPGKNFPNTGAFGPYMVTPDEMGPIGKQRLQTRVNSAAVQDATLDDMIFDIPTIINYCSEFTILEPGDVIATGTPGGVGAKRDPQLWLKPGDLVEVEIDGVGLLQNMIVQET